MTEPVDYQAVLADLKIRRARLDQLIGGIEAYVMWLGESVPVAPALDLTPPGVLVSPAEIHAQAFHSLTALGPRV